jgi:hypothetical protein
MHEAATTGAHPEPDRDHSLASCTRDKRLNKAPSAVDTYAMSRDTHNHDETITLSALLTEVLREQAWDPTVRPLIYTGRIPSEHGCMLVSRLPAAGEEGL